MKRTKFAIESEKYAKENPFVEKGKPESPVFFSAAWERSCDHCQHQEGRHYCLLHGITVKNMDALCCLKWEERDEKDNVIKALQANITEIMANKAELASENRRLKSELDSRSEWIKRMNIILGYDNSDGFHSEPDPFTIAESLVRKNNELENIASQVPVLARENEELRKALLRLLSDAVPSAANIKEGKCLVEMTTKEWDEVCKATEAAWAALE